MNCYYELVAEPGNRISIEILDVDMEAQIFRSCLDYIGFYEAFGQCDAGWLSREDGNCYRYVEAQPKVGWADAQEQCSQMQSNLASIRDQRDFDYMSRTFGHTPAHAWVGYTDADEEGNIMGVDSTSNTIWP
ncbi:hypothetical protein ANCDUO_00244 [Ancylostoma duodenale]|uniref:C-type lectin domain-containing protein n=1 Tax=Ancylostoma duodenale TaxID=51022 RepID=A0A0C2DHJ4_9BILA|nr:hypothetical protein ANCDUO_00244 [Ancylostoma duodenale]